MVPHKGKVRSIQIIHHELLDESDIEVVLPERVIAGFEIFPDGWIKSGEKNLSVLLPGTQQMPF